MIFDIFSSCVKYKYKSTSYCFHILILLLITIVIIVPIIIIKYTGGFWIEDWCFMQQPVINFKYQYLLIVERNENQPIVCSTFSYYKDNPLSDDCSLIKIHEIDLNQDGQKDILKLEARFFSNKPVRGFKLFLLFSCEFKDRIQIAFDTTADIHYNLVKDFQKLYIAGDLLLIQKKALQSDSYIVLNEKYQTEDFPYFQFVNSSKTFAAKIVNDHPSWQSGFTKDEEIVMTFKIFYNEQHIHYELGTLEKYKWAFIQYLSIFIVCAYILNSFISIIIQKRCFRGYLIVPWKKVN